MGLPKLLLTGSCGLIGSILWRHLADSFELYGTDVRITEPTAHLFRADISNYEQIASVLQTASPLPYVIHLAADPRVNAEWPSVLTNNIIGTRNLYEAAKNNGIKRVIFASSNHVTGAYEGIPPSLHSQVSPALITTQHPIRPDGYYGVSKVFGEAIARMYYELHGLESVCLRIGWVLKDDDPTKNEQARCTWLSHRDLVQLVKRSLLTEVEFGIYYGVSNNKHRFWDISNAKEELGYEPEDDASSAKGVKGSI
jgi:nucleoside-diphosphate-sugar epimerase